MTSLARRVQAATELWIVYGMVRETHQGQVEDLDRGLGAERTEYYHTERVEAALWALTEDDARKLVERLRKGWRPQHLRGLKKIDVWRLGVVPFAMELSEDEAIQLCDRLAGAWMDRYAALTRKT